MLQRLFARFALCASVLSLAVLPLWAGATELGEPLVRSYVGQPLVADIELTGFVEAQTVQVKLAHQEVYNAANIRKHPILANLTMSVMRRDGRQYLHITSIKPLESDYVHLFLELIDGARRDIRSVTLWVTADPHPAPPPAPVPVPVAPLAPKVQTEAVAEPELPTPMPKASPLRAHAPKAAACKAEKPQFTEAQIRTCAALDYKNGALTAQIVELEEKVKLLQLAMEGKKAAKASVSASAAVPAPIKLPPKLTVPASAPAKANAKAEPAPFPWLWIGIGVAVLLVGAGGAFWFVKRKKAAKDAPAEARPGLLARLKGRFSKKAKADEAPAPEERVEPAAS